MKQHEEVTFQTLANNEDIQIGYSDNDIVVIDSIQQFNEVNTAHVAMNAIVICTNGKVQARLNGIQMELHKNQVAIVPQNVTATDVMVSPDFNLKAMFLTNRILQSFLHEKMNVWNDMMYVHRNHIVTMDEDEILFYTHFYDMLTLAIERGKENPYHTEIIQALLRSAILGLCGAMKWMLSSNHHETHTTDTHFQRFLDLLHSTDVKHRTVEAYANDLCISPKYLTAICKKHSGRTANEWITEHVLEDIRYYLKQTDLSMKQICDQLGFPNPSFFGKYVKDHFGMTPMEFRNN
ncbi:helix-turn-helix domain-containing protein [uncultured Prevotella sp.]|uniref:helix-turn-helix domain-containing protein n=1 Tax=uncultured Prevotella sp. TaxID=159272 RepID=UPI0025E70168|nr:helix-turn-helix domain-containing protein [uncultured Prevotella sp.]